MLSEYWLLGALETSGGSWRSTGVLLPQCSPTGMLHLESRNQWEEQGDGDLFFDSILGTSPSASSRKEMFIRLWQGWEYVEFTRLRWRCLG